jgi:hypothetical protein
MKSTQRKVSGAPLPTRIEGFLFAVKTFFLQRKRFFKNVFHPLSRSKPHADFPNGVLLSQSVSLLRFTDEETSLALIDGKIHNIRNAIKRLDEIVVHQGEIFSFWRYVGKLTKSKGYVLGRELREGCIIPKIGGGICQLSNAIYDAALKANLEIVERHGHSAVIKGSLAEWGRDATVFWNYLDLRLKGSQNWQLQVKMDKERLTVSIFGESSVFLTFCSVVGYAPTLTDRKVISDFLNGTVMLARESCQTAILHKIGKIIQSREVAGDTVIVAYTPEFRVICVYYF